MTILNCAATTMKVLIGYDGSACARAAIHDLGRAGLPAVGEAVVLSVADLVVEKPFQAYAEGSEQLGATPPLAIVEEMRRVAAEAMEEARSLAVDGVERVLAVLPGWTVRSETAAESPYWALIRRAEEWPADLVVIGSRGRVALSRFLLGSVSQTVLGHVPCSVRIGRSRNVDTEQEPTADHKAEKTGQPIRIILAVDGSSDAAVAAKAVGERNWPAGTEVRVVTVVDPRWTLNAAGFGELTAVETDEHDIARLARRRVGAVARQLQEERGLRVTADVLIGNPRRVLVEEAERWNADGVFLGARGHSRLERFLIGSVSSSVAARAHCSVEVVRQAGVQA